MKSKVKIMPFDGLSNNDSLEQDFMYRNQYKAIALPMWIEVGIIQIMISRADNNRLKITVYKDSNVFNEPYAEVFIDGFTDVATESGSVKPSRKRRTKPSGIVERGEDKGSTLPKVRGKHKV